MNIYKVNVYYLIDCGNGYPERRYYEYRYFKAPSKKIIEKCMDIKYGKKNALYAKHYEDSLIWTKIHNEIEKVEIAGEFNESDIERTQKEVNESNLGVAKLMNKLINLKNDQCKNLTIS